MCYIVYEKSGEIFGTYQDTGVGYSNFVESLEYCFYLHLRRINRLTRLRAIRAPYAGQRKTRRVSAGRIVRAVGEAG